MRRRFLALCIALGFAAVAGPARAAVSISIGINLPTYPRLVLVPGLPVHYAPGLRANFFFYDGLYWVLEGDVWYMSDWYNGPWQPVAPALVPYFLLRIPVRYFRVPPPYFRGWPPGAPPRWGEHWGSDWERQHRNWNQWDRRQAPPPAPLPRYQRRYPADRYPGADQQRELRGRHYPYRPHSDAARQHFGPPERGPGRRDDARPGSPR